MDTTFEDVVARDVRGEALTPEEELLLSMNVREWINELNVLLRNVEIQFNAHKAELTKAQIKSIEDDDKLGWLRAKAEDQHWRVGSNRFRASVEKRLHHAKTLRAEPAVYA